VLFVAPSLGQVTRDLRVPDECAIRAAQCREHHVGPEPRTILAHPPALVLEVAIARRGFQFEARRFPFEGFRRIEHGAMAANDLFALVTLD
jgi:hypothetical protein